MTRDELIARFEEHCTRLPRIWTIYDHPRDVPGAYVVRCAAGLAMHPDAFLTQKLESARKYCQEQGADFCLLPNECDDPCILESWI